MQNSRLPSLRGIEAFVCVAEVLNLRVASERLNVTVSAVSHRIQGLEEELGVKLFERGNRRLKLTHEGQHYFERLSVGLQALRTAAGQARAEGGAAVLRIAAPAVFHQLWLVPRIGEFLANRPGVRVEMLSYGHRRSAGVDISVVPLTPGTQREGAVPLMEISIAPMCSPQFLNQHPITAPRDLLDLPLIDFAPSHDGWRNWFAGAGMDDTPAPARVAVDQHMMLAEAAMNHLGVAIGDPRLFRPLIEQGLLVLPFEEHVLQPPHLGLIVRNRGQERLAEAFAHWLQAEMAAMD